MITTWIFSKMRHFLPLMVSIVVIAFTGCSESPISGLPDGEERSVPGEIIIENFKVLPSGTAANLLDGSIILEFHPGTVRTPTRFTITSFPLDNLKLDDYNLMKRAITLANSSNTNSLEKPVQLTMRYDLAKFSRSEPDEVSSLNIYRLYGDMYSFHKLECIGECCMNCSCKTVTGSITEYGSYVVGMN